MPESGGPTAQSGAYFQNTVAAWYLAKMIHDAMQKHVDNRVIRIRCEAPEDIDDIVVTFDQGKHYIQVKESIVVNSPIWTGLWVDFWSQFIRIDPLRERLVLWGGQYTSQFRDLQEIVKRARSTPPGSRRKQFTEFSNRLSKTQHAMFDSIVGFIQEAETEPESERRSDEVIPPDIFEMLRSVDVVVKGNAEEIQEQAVNMYLNGLENPQMNFTVLRDLAAEKARSRGVWNRENLLQALNERGFDLNLSDFPQPFQTSKEALERELEMHTNNLYILRRQGAVYGAALVPLHLRNQIDQEEHEIRQIEQRLAQLQ